MYGKYTIGDLDSSPRDAIKQPSVFPIHHEGLVSNSL